jgi:hypothetical protein
MIPALLLLCQFSEPPRPAPPEQLIPPAAAVVLPPDRIAEGRPKVVMITAANCRPCAEAEAWMRTNGFPFEIDRRAPAAGDSTPTWRFQGADGKWWQIVGWDGRATVEALVRAYAEKNPRLENNSIASVRKPRANDTGKEALPDTLRRFAGETGTIVFRPDGKRRATVTDGVTLDVGEITARYDLRGEPKITFTDPQPRGTVEKFGFGIGFVLQSATYQAPDTVRVGTNWKTITVRLDDD